MGEHSEIVKWPKGEKAPNLVPKGMENQSISAPKKERSCHGRSRLKILLRGPILPPGEGNCGLCGNWGQRTDSQFGYCRSVKIIRRIWGPGTELHKIEPDCAVVENDEGWGICTGIMFGCVHWEGRG